MGYMDEEDDQKKTVDDYLKQKYESEGLGDTNRAGLEAKVNENEPAGWRKALMAVGASAGGRDAGSAVRSLYGDQDKARQDLRDFDNRRADVVKNYLMNQRFQQERQDRIDMNEDRKLDRKQKQEQIDFMKNQALQDKKDKDVRERTVGGVGLARTADDAKNLKEAAEIKASFDNNLNEMIALREKHGGGTNRVTNAEDVERGEQLSKDLLLQYKQLAKLGVLSQSDMAILNKIIPKDPLEYSFSIGQDPIMANMKKLKQDKDKEYETRLGTRLEKRNEKPADFPRTVRNAKTGETAQVSNESELKEANQAGFQ